MKLKKKVLDSEIFTGSMADITFLLIIFFMVTMAFSSNRGIDFALPEDTTTAAEISQEESVDVLVLPEARDRATAHQGHVGQSAVMAINPSKAVGLVGVVRCNR